MKLSNKEKIIKKLIEIGKTLSVSESCTGGKISSEITKISGVSEIFLSSMIVYSNKSKSKFLKIDKKTIDKYGAVSEKTAKLMARNCLKINNSDFAISTTGIAGPSGATKNKPIGLVFIGIASKKRTYVYKFRFKGSRISIQNKITKKAFELFYKILK